MTFTPEETAKIKAMLLFIIHRKQKDSDGKCGFNVTEFRTFFEELEADGEISKRPTINSEAYFLTNK